MGNEITMKLASSINEFYTILESKGFKVVDKFLLDDTYFIPKDIDIYKVTPREVLKQYILIRNITQYMPPNEYKVLKMTYKSKNIASNGEIISQKNIDCNIDNVEEGKAFLKAIGYKEIMNIKENNLVYGKDGLKIAVKDIQNGDKLIEVETDENNEELNTIQKLKHKLNELQLPLDMSDYFVKKAEIELQKLL